MSNIFFSVIIPTLNRNDLLAKCLDKLAPNIQTIDLCPYEVIVTNDSKISESTALNVKDYPWVKWVEGPKRGPAANRNNGAKYAKGEWLIFLDDDVIPDSKLLSAYANAINNDSSIKACEGAIHPDDWTLLEKDMAECPVNLEGGVFWSANICINRIFFEQIGGFDEQFKIAAQEDQDLFERIKKLSSVKFIQDAKVVHPVRFPKMMTKIFNIPKASKNYSIYVRKHSISSCLSILISQYELHFRVFVKYLIKGQFKSSVVELVWLIFGIPLNIFNILKANYSF